MNETTQERARWNRIAHLMKDHGYKMYRNREDEIKGASVAARIGPRERQLVPRIAGAHVLRSVRRRIVNETEGVDSKRAAESRPAALPIVIGIGEALLDSLLIRERGGDQVPHRKSRRRACNACAPDIGAPLLSTLLAVAIP